MKMSIISPDLLAESQQYIFKVNGNWSDWSEWTKCSKFCGGGKTLRHRKCTNPEPLHNGLDCAGRNKEEEKCNTKLCRGKVLLVFVVLIYCKYYIFYN